MTTRDFTQAQLMERLSTTARSGSGLDNVHHYCAEAYDEIDRQAAEIARLREQQSILDHNHDHYAKELACLRAALEEIKFECSHLLSIVEIALANKEVK